MANQRGGHPAFTYAVLVSFAGGAGYLLKGHLPSMVGGIGLGVGFLGAGMLVLSDVISNHHFEHGTCSAMSGFISGVMGQRAVATGLRTPAALAGLGALSAGYHAQQMLTKPRSRFNRH